ncbi:MAG: hypothetical protein AB7J13_09680 [Pyrinomonadaceae bacterium]
MNAVLGKLMNIVLFSDGIRFSLTSRQMPVTIVFPDRNSAEIVGIYVSRVLDR